MCNEEAHSPGPTGACGISCWVCRAYLAEVCTCSPGDSPEAEVAMAVQEKRWGKPCAILACTVERKISFCGKDCEDYPCELHGSADSPASEPYLSMIRRRMKAATSQ